MNNLMPASRFSPLLVLVFGAICISYAPIFVKWVGESRLGPTAMGFWRTLFGALTLFLIAVVRRDSLKMNVVQFRFAIVAGFIFFLDLFVWHRSVIFCGAGMSTILGNTQVFATALFSFIVFKEKLTVKYFISAVSAMGGVILLVGVLSEDVQFTSRYIDGVAFGLATGLAYGSYLLTIKQAGRKGELTNIVTFMAWTSASSALFLGIAAVIEPGPVLPPDLESLGHLVALGVVAQAIGWWAITSALKKIDASRAGLILLLQPTLAMVWGIVYFSEQFTLVQFVGAVITITAIYFGGLRNAGKHK